MNEERLAFNYFDILLPIEYSIDKHRYEELRYYLTNYLLRNCLALNYCVKYECIEEFIEKTIVLSDIKENIRSEEIYMFSFLIAGCVIATLKKKNIQTEHDIPYLTLYFTASLLEFYNQ